MTLLFLLSNLIKCVMISVMEKIIALDIGLKRIGVATTDPFGTYALPVETYHRKNLKTDIPYLVNLCKSRGATLIVCGLPLNFDGTRSIQTERTEYFIDRLKEATDIRIETADERLTTVEAHRTLIEEDMSREKRKQYVDSLAATYILEGYLRKIKNKS